MSVAGPNTVSATAQQAIRRAPRSPKVTVLMLSYNHAEFISEAIESVLGQQTSFDFDIVLGDDGSTDGSRDIIARYQERFPDRVRVLFGPNRVQWPPYGLPQNHNFAACYRHCRGEYVAFLEGDDFWTDAGKLERQVAALERDVSVAVCSHAVDVHYVGPRVRHWPDRIGVADPVTYTIEDLLASRMPEAHWSSLVMRRRVLKRLPAWYFPLFNGDTALLAILLGHGSAVFLPAAMSVHRKHVGGVTTLYETDRDYCDDQRLRLYQAIDGHYSGRFHHLLQPLLAAGLRARLERDTRDRRWWSTLRTRLGLYHEEGPSTRVLIEKVAQSARQRLASLKGATGKDLPSVIAEWNSHGVEEHGGAIGYGKGGRPLIVRDSTETLLFHPETSQDHVALPFVHAGDPAAQRRITLIVNFPAHVAARCTLSLQDQDFRTLILLPPAEKVRLPQRVTLGSDVEQVRIVCQGDPEAPVALPSRIRLMTEALAGDTAKT